MTVQTSQLIDTLRDMLSGSDFEGIVIGRPHLIGGGTTDSAPHIDDVADKIRKAWPGMAIHFVDESLTSKEAYAIQIQGGMKKSKRRERQLGRHCCQLDSATSPRRAILQPLTGIHSPLNTSTVFCSRTKSVNRPS